MSADRAAAAMTRQRMKASYNGPGPLGVAYGSRHGHEVRVRRDDQGRYVPPRQGGEATEGSLRIALFVERGGGPRFRVVHDGIEMAHSGWVPGDITEDVEARVGEGRRETPRVFVRRPSPSAGGTYRR